jgi:hypothetical protein
MIRPGRKSAAELASPPVDGSSPRLRPPEHLDDRERALFVELINACAPQHFVKSDAPLLAAYVQSILLSRSAVKHAGKDPAALALWEKSTRMTATLERGCA